MWQVDNIRAYPFIHTHRNLFPPTQRPLSDVLEERESEPSVHSSSSDEFGNFDQISEVFGFPLPPGMPRTFSDRDQDIKKAQPAEAGSPEVFTFPLPPGMHSTTSHPNSNIEESHPAKSKISNMGRSDRQLPETLPRFSFEPFVFPALKEYPALTPPLACPPPFMFPVTKHQDCRAPAAVVTSLLQDVLEIMNNIMSEQGRVEEESEILSELVELVAIMQQEAEALVELVDYVEEYTEEIDTIVELEEWVEELESIRSPSPVPWSATSQSYPIFHGRADSGDFLPITSNPQTPMTPSHLRGWSTSTRGDTDSAIGMSESSESNQKQWGNEWQRKHGKGHRDSGIEVQQSPLIAYTSRTFQSPQARIVNMTKARPGMAAPSKAKNNVKKRDPPTVYISDWDS